MQKQSEIRYAFISGMSVMMIVMSLYGTFRGFDQNYFISQFNLVKIVVLSLPKEGKK